MPSFHYTHTRERDRTTTSPPPPPSLPRRTSFKRPRLFSSDSDSGHDDYPYAGNHRPSRALVKRDQPTQLERWGIWTDTRKQERCDSGAEDNDSDMRPQRRVSFAARDVLQDGEEERAFRLRVATLARSRPRLASPPPARRRLVESDDERWGGRGLSIELVRERERCVSEDYEAHERIRSRSRERRHRERVWCDEDDQREMDVEAERWVSWRRVKRTRTEERRPLAGWRRV
ncbi:hypothetical protein N0V95_000131 [Ascochyta clinopodiicola]|nr:hypothetical protein N0V95_000131 [Ascochyta clinopodiicola]